MRPCRFEGEIQNLEIEGKIPECITGTFYRVMPDPQLPPFIDNDPVSYSATRIAGLTASQWFNGDGNVSAFRIGGGRVHFKQRFVRTEKFVRERKAQRALLGTLQADVATQ